MITQEPQFVCLTVLSRERKVWDDALSDVLIWLDGFKSAGGKYSPETEHHLKDLRDAVRRAYNTIPPCPPKP